MNFKNVLTEDDAVSPVIGVILMVAITVILAAVIGTFVLGLGDQVSNTAPSASFTFDLTDNDVTAADELSITHDGGDKIAASQIGFSSSGVYAADNDGTSGDEATGGIASSSATWEDVAGSGDVTAGSTVTLAGANFEGEGVSGTVKTFDGNDLDTTTSGDSDSTDSYYVELQEATIRVTWQSSNGGDTATLGKWTGPDA